MPRGNAGDGPGRCVNVSEQTIALPLTPVSADEMSNVVSFMSAEMEAGLCLRAVNSFTEKGTEEEKHDNSGTLMKETGERNGQRNALTLLDTIMKGNDYGNARVFLTESMDLEECVRQASVRNSPKLSTVPAPCNSIRETTTDGQGSHAGSSVTVAGASSRLQPSKSVRFINKGTFDFD